MSQKNNILEMYVAEKMKKIYEYSRPSIASGATPIEKGDVDNPYFLIECKIRNTKSFSIKNDAWEKTKSRAAKEYKDALYIAQNKSGQRLAIMDLDEWFELAYELFKLRNKA